MAGRPRHRARMLAEMARAGQEAPEWHDPRQTLKPRGSYQPPERDTSPRMPTAGAVGAEDVEGLEVILGGLTSDDLLDEETHSQFVGLRKLAFQFALEVMELPLEPGNKNFSKILSVKQAIAQSVMTASVRVAPNDMRERDDDGVGALLDQVKRASGEPVDRPLTAEEMLS